uniref:Protein kinase domain-containing protein n=1 Tax=Meloidogyne incognita TaxID=6306 RepID=A0A914LRT5_MELIC
MNCSFFHGPKSLSFDETKELLEKNGDFLIQDYRDLQLLLSVKVYGKIQEFVVEIIQECGQLLFSFLNENFNRLEDLVLAFSSGRDTCFIQTREGDQFQLIRPIKRRKFAGRFGYGECLNIRDSVQPNKIEPGFVRILRHDFSSCKQVEEDLEKLIEIKHRNLVRVLDFFILHSCSYNGSPLIFIRFDQITKATSLFDRLFDLQNVLPSRQYIKWGYQAAKGLNFLMDRGILHKRLTARSCLLDNMENLRLSDFWTENDPGDLNLFQRNLPNSISQRTIMFSDGWRYLPAETLINNQFDCTSQVWTFGLLIWQIYTHHQFGNRIIYSSMEEFLSLTAGRDDPYFMPGHLNKKESQQGMPEQRRRKAVFLKASEQLPHPPESLAKIIPSALLPDRSERPYFSEIFRILECEKRILDLAHVIGQTY